jgi:hypothetical protein
MGEWRIDVTSEPGVLRLKLAGALTPQEIADYVAAHNAAIDALGDFDYKVWADLSELEPLCPQSTAILEQAKRYSSARPNFRGSSVFVSAGTVALQQRHTSIRSGVLSTELISDDLVALRAHLQSVYRR